MPPLVAAQTSAPFASLRHLLCVVLLLFLLVHCIAAAEIVPQLVRRRSHSRRGFLLLLFLASDVYLSLPLFVSFCYSLRRCRHYHRDAFLSYGATAAATTASLLVRSTRLGSWPRSLLPFFLLLRSHLPLPSPLYTSPCPEFCGLPSSPLVQLPRVVSLAAAFVSFCGPSFLSSGLSRGDS